MIPAASIHPDVHVLMQEKNTLLESQWKLTATHVFAETGNGSAQKKYVMAHVQP